MKAAQDEKRSLDDRKAICEKLNRIIPNYNAQIDETTGKYRASKEALDAYLKSLTRKYELEGAKDKLAEIGKEKAEAQIDLTDAQEKLAKVKKNPASHANISTSGIGYVQDVQGQALDHFTSKVESANARLEAALAKESKILEAYGADLKEAAVAEAIQEQNADASSGMTTKDYQSEKAAEKARKAAEAARNKAENKAKKELKEALDKVQAERDKAETQALAERSAGLIDYRKYLDCMREIEVDYYAQADKVYQEARYKDESGHAALLKKKQEAEEKYNQQTIAINKEAYERIAQVREREATAEYEAKENKTFADEIAYKEKILSIRYTKLIELQSLYDKNSKEWEDLERQMKDLLEQDQMEKRKTLMAKMAEYQKELDKKSVAERYALEYAALKALYDNGMFEEEKYQKWVKKLREQESRETKEEKKALPGSTPAGANTAITDASETYEKQMRELREALDAGIIDQEEFEKRAKRIKNAMMDAMVDPLKRCGDQWVELMATMGDSWRKFAEALDDPDGNPLLALGAAAGATAALVSAVTSQVTEMMQAELEVQTAAITKRYDKEIELAEGNSYLTAKLEKEKEARISKAKNDASRKMYAMQVINAVAQTATNALNAYGSAAAIPVVGHILAPIAAAMATAAGLVQIATIKKQQQASEAQGYSEGGFTRPGAVDEPAGIVHAGEWVASQKLLASPVARPMIEALDYVQRTNTIGSLRSEDVSRSITSGQSLSMIADGSASGAMVASAMAGNAEVLSRLVRRLEQPFVTVNTVTGDAGIKSAQDEYLKLMNNKSPKHRRNASYS